MSQIIEHQTASSYSGQMASQPLTIRACAFKSFLSIALLIIFSFQSIAQDAVSIIGQNCNVILSPNSPLESTPITGGKVNLVSNYRYKKGKLLLSIISDTLTQQQVKSRVKLATISNIVGYSAILVYLNAAWYSDYPRGSFRFFNDNSEWLQIDKVGHMYGAYIESRTSMELWRWTGIDRKKRIWIGGLSGAAYQTVIEILDGFSREWGWSWGDFSANILGSASLISQELAWDDQRIKLKFSFHRKNYRETDLNKRADEIFGKTLAERFIKDYNAQTYWASANLKSFFPTSNLPPWLAVAVGHGAEGIFGARANVGTSQNNNTAFDRRDIRRYRQWYLAPDIDFTKIKTNKKGVKLLFFALSAFKFPTPSLEFSRGKFKLNTLHF